MNKVIIHFTLKVIWPLMAIYSVYILLRGHNEPGGGFIGGLLLALSLILRFMSEERANSLSVEKKNEAKFYLILPLSLLTLIVVSMLPTLFGQAVLQGLWTKIWLPIAGKFSSVLVFDTVVYILVATCAYLSFLKVDQFVEEKPS